MAPSRSTSKTARMPRGPAPASEHAEAPAEDRGVADREALHRVVRRLEDVDVLPHRRLGRDVELEHAQDARRRGADVVRPVRVVQGHARDREDRAAPRVEGDRAEAAEATVQREVEVHAPLRVDPGERGGAEGAGRALGHVARDKRSRGVEAPERRAARVRQPDLTGRGLRDPLEAAREIRERHGRAEQVHGQLLVAREPGGGGSQARPAGDGRAAGPDERHLDQRADRVVLAAEEEVSDRELRARVDEGQLAQLPSPSRSTGEGRARTAHEAEARRTAGGHHARDPARADHVARGAHRQRRRLRPGAPRSGEGGPLERGRRSAGRAAVIPTRALGRGIDRDDRVVLRARDPDHRRVRGDGDGARREGGTPALQATGSERPKRSAPPRPRRTR